MCRISNEKAIFLNTILSSRFMGLCIIEKLYFDKTSITGVKYSENIDIERHHEILKAIWVN
jgi:hypothetical protein